MIVEKPIYVNPISENEIKNTHGILGYLKFKVAALFGIKSVVKDMLHKIRPTSDGKTVSTAYHTVQEALDEARNNLSKGYHDYVIQIVEEEYK